jgi:iron(III) transport system permease protein
VDAKTRNGKQSDKDKAPDRRRGPGTARVLKAWAARARDPKVIILLTVTLIVGYLTLVPLGYLLFGTFFEDGNFSLDAFSRAFGSVPLGEVTYNSIVFSVGATVVSVVVGTFLAYLTERTDIAAKRLIFAGALVPLVIPGILYTISWIFLGSPRIGIINHVLEPLLGPEAYNVFSLSGMVLVQGLDNAPLVFLLMVAGLRMMDPSLEEAALLSGATLPSVFRRVTLPLAKPSLYAATLIMFLRNIEAFETPALLGMTKGIWVFTSRIWRVLQYPSDYGQAGAYSLTLLLVAFVGMYFQSRLTNQGRRYQTVTGKGYRPRALPLGRWRKPMTVLVLIYFAIAILLPTLVLFYMATQPYYSVPSLETIKNSSLSNFQDVFHRPQVVRAFRNSFTLAMISASIVMFLTAIASWITVKTKIKGRWILDNLTFLPIVIPGLVLGVALIFVYLRLPIAIYGTFAILLVAYVTKYIPYGMRFAASSMYQIGGELEESAEVAGASWRQTFFRINIPLLMPGLIAGWIYVVLVGVRELSTSILLYSPGNEVLSVVIWEMYENGQFNQLAALGAILILTLFILVAIAQRLGAKVGVQ